MGVASGPRGPNQGTFWVPGRSRDRGARAKVSIASARRIIELQTLSIQVSYLTILQDRCDFLRTIPCFLAYSGFRVPSGAGYFATLFFTETIQPSRRLRFATLDVRKSLLKYLEVISKFRTSSSLFVLFQGSQSDPPCDIVCIQLEFGFMSSETWGTLHSSSVYIMGRESWCPYREDLQSSDILKASTFINH